MNIAVYYNLAFGGAKRVVYEHIKGLQSHGHTVDVYTIDKSHDIFDPGIHATNEYRYDFSSKEASTPIFGRVLHDFNTFVRLKKMHKQIAKDINKRKYDIALIHTDTLTQAPFVLRSLTTKNVYFCLEPLRMVHEYSLRTPENLGFLNRFYEFLNKSIRKKIDATNALAANHVTAISLFAREYMILAYDLYPKISYLGVDTNVFKPMSIRKKNQVLFIGQKLSLNGYDYAVQAINLIPKKIRPELKVITLPKNKQERLSEEEIVMLYNESVVTLSLSTFDTFGLIPIESMACGTPVIAFNCAAYRETIINGKTGFLVDFNPQEIAEKIMSVQDNSQHAKEMGKCGRAWVEKKWTWERQITDLEKLLKTYAKENESMNGKA